VLLERIARSGAVVNHPPEAVVVREPRRLVDRDGT
jgi:hypothetical protein